MTRVGTFLLTLCLILVSTSCQATSETMTSEEQSQIEAELRAAFDTMVQGMNQHDVDMILSVYARSVVYTGDGVKDQNWDTFREQTTAFHNAAENQDWRAEIAEVQVTVFSPEVALLTAWGRSGVGQGRPYAVTDVFQRTTEGWKVVHEHESTADPQL